MRRPEQHLTLLWRVLLICGCIGIITNLLHAATKDFIYQLPATIQVLINLAFMLGMPTLALAYIAGLTLLLLQPFWQRISSPLAAVGRIALSNYLLQSLIGTTLFYGYGFGLYARLGAAPIIGLTILIYALQVLLSVWWLRHYRFGPLEWLWRSLTYGKLMPFAAPGKEK